jgi:hypothetical protein
MMTLPVMREYIGDQPQPAVGKIAMRRLERVAATI